MPTINFNSHLYNGPSGLRPWDLTYISICFFTIPGTAMPFIRPPPPSLHSANSSLVNFFVAAYLSERLDRCLGASRCLNLVSPPPTHTYTLPTHRLSTRQFLHQAARLNCLSDARMLACSGQDPSPVRPKRVKGATENLRQPHPPLSSALLAGRYAIAYSVLAYLTRQVQSRIIFATHYHPLTAEFSGDPRVKLGYMAAAVASSSQASAGLPCITFLYKLLQGVSPESYGLQVTFFPSPLPLHRPLCFLSFTT